MKPTAEPCNSILEKLTALPELLFGAKKKKKITLQPISPLHSDQQQEESKVWLVTQSWSRGEGLGVFLSTPETGAAASPFSTSHPSAGVLLVGTCSAICIGAAQPLCERAGGDRDAKGRFPDSKIILGFASF